MKESRKRLCVQTVIKSLHSVTFQKCLKIEDYFFGQHAISLTQENIFMRHPVACLHKFFDNFAGQAGLASCLTIWQIIKGECENWYLLPSLLVEALRLFETLDTNWSEQNGAFLVFP